MDFETLEALRQRTPAWRLLRADNAALVLSFLGQHFVEENRGATSATDVAAALDEHLYALNTDPAEPRFPKAPLAYLEDWSAPDAGWLRRFYPATSEEVHYEVTPDFEKANTWVESLRSRPFVGTESRLHTVVDLLRQIVHGTQTDPKLRLAELRRRRDEIDAEIAAVEGGDVPVMDATGVRDRYQQLSVTARELLSDFREVEENFRSLDRSARERIATWEGSKGELLSGLVGSRADIAGSDQGRSFQAFYDFLLSDTRYDELAELLAQASSLDAVETDGRLRSIHHEWSEAAERAQRTVRHISEQLRRFLDDQVWVENRRVLDLVRTVETAALAVRATPPDFGLALDEPGVAIALPFERPLFDARPASTVESLLPPEPAEELDTEALFTQDFVDPTRLIEQVRTVVPPRSSVLLDDLVGLFPIEQGAAEIVGYLALHDDEILVELDETGETLLDYHPPGAEQHQTRRARLPRATVRRR